MNKSLNFRKDSRTIEEFVNDIEQRTSKERFLVNLFSNIMEVKGHSIFVEDNGIGNDGKLVSKSSCRPDFQITIDGKSGLYEVKNSFLEWKWTFKVYQLQQYIKYKANILIFWGTDRIDKDHTAINLENTRWGIIETKGIEAMLMNHEVYNESSFGNKPCIQVKLEDFEKYVNKINRIEI